MGLALIDVAVPLEDFDFTTADRWHVVMLDHGVPLMAVELASPGKTSGPHLAHAAILRHADRALEFKALQASLSRRLGVLEPPAPQPIAVSVVVCTHGRPGYLERCFTALGALDPAPAEVVIVDNAPGTADCRELVESHGFRYVREDRKGLDRARNAGIAAAGGEVIAFTDDDCVPAPRWLASVPELFASPLIGAITGPALPATLETEAQVAMERQASPGRGYRAQQWDWTTLSPAHAGRVGAGANMLIRRTALAALGTDPFPPELDAGTSTQSGGDTYVMSRLLATGWRVRYDPGTFVLHVHRPDAAALHRAIVGYGCGLGAVMTKLLVEDRELEAFGALAWLPRQLWDTARRFIAGRADPEELQISWRYLRGGLEGPWRWWRAPHRARRTVPEVQAMAACSGIEGAPTAALAGAAQAAEAGAPAVSVIVPTVHRPGPLARCLGALAHQDVDPTGFEVLVIDDAPDGGARLNDGVPYTARLLRAGGGGAAAARNLGAVEARGRILLFLDDDLVPAPDLVRRHLDAHEPGGDPAVVIGRSAPRPPRGSLSELGAGLWWEDLFAGMRRAPVLTFPQTLSGNASVPREAFLALGGFPEDMARRRREDWAWGLALQEARVPVRYVHEAVAHHEFRLDPVGRWRAARQEARGDALVLRRWPNALPGLPAMGRVGAPPQRFRGRLWRAALTSEVGGRRAAAVLARLERLRLRRAWMRLNGAGERVAYDAGLRDEGLVLPDVAPEGLDVCDVDLRAEDPIPAPEHGMPVLRVHAGPGEELRLPSPEGDWGAPLADHLARAVPWSLWRLALARPPAAAEVPADPAQVTLVTRPSFARFPVGMRRAPLVVDEDWAAVDRALATATTPYVIVAFDALVTSQEWLDAALLPFTGDRVAVVTGEVHEGEDPEPPTVLHDLDRRALPYQRFPLRMAYVALRVSAVADVGGLDLSQARHGPHAPLLDLLERLLEAGHVVAERNAPELGRAWAANGQRAMHVAPLERTGARMALARARSQGGAAGAVLGVRTLFRAAGSIRRSAGGRAAWLMGALRR